MPGLVPGIHVFLNNRAQGVDGRDEPGHDELKRTTPAKIKTGPEGPAFPRHLIIGVDQIFLFAAAAALFTASLVASLASPTAFWPLPLIS
jgi:hypothetical protein